MKRLRQALGVLTDEGRAISDRFPEALSMVTGLGKAVATGILTVAYPDKYGVWNNTSEAAIRKVGLWPSFEGGEGVGRRYEKINSLLVRLSSDVGIDLWTLDALWWFLLEPPPLARGIHHDLTRRERASFSNASLRSSLWRTGTRLPLRRNGPF
jgi:hypothetical protein